MNAEQDEDDQKIPDKIKKTMNPNISWIVA
jgi:hypothetical protein